VYVAGEERSPEGRTADLRNVRLLGRLAPVEMLGWFCRASIYVHPAYYEPFGLSVLEAALSRCALILSDIPSLREMWDGCALFVTPEDANALSGALRSLIASASLRGMLAARAYDRALGLNPNGMAEQYLEAYAAALRNRQATARRQEGRLCAS
ncbi:MAG: glycosyltransferase, partial [Burkholderiales bacterium]